ncbi:MAG: hypothetical protein HOW73_14935 [Polyangiaceae bacterium]|nr:hypothetical protein [Polyangiaceae bacterium]
MQLPPRPLLELQRERASKRPTIRVHASTDDAPPSEWGSLLGDLARPSRLEPQSDIEWRIHDKTHLEFAIDYPFRADPVEYRWEAYFFVPDSFRLEQTTYDKKQIYDDLLSYVRLAVPEMPFEAAARACESGDAGSPIADLREALRKAEGFPDESPPSKTVVRTLRIFACMIRASGLEAQRVMLADVDDARTAEQAAHATASFAKLAHRIAAAYRAVIDDSAKMDLSGECRVALKWVDEDLSLFLEALVATASVRVHQRAQSEGDRWGDVASRLAAEAVIEARYRRARGYESVGNDDASPRDIEHFEFRRHVLKRFTSSVLWLKNEVREGATWMLHLLYAGAAALAMAFAVLATIKAMDFQAYLMPYAILLVISYAVKDRMKAILQTVFARWAEKRFPDRAWTIRGEERPDAVGVVHENAGFREFENLPKGVLDARRVTREHAIEEYARPETVLWHTKKLKLVPRKEGELPSPMMTEIFRLNIGSWLAHTDDPNRTITFADPDEGAICSVTARRVYNINVVYRLASRTEERAWRRIRVVVSRKGIERIDPIV